MGMLFNTEGTLRILKMLTEKFSRQSFKSIQNAGVGGASTHTLITALTSSIGTNSTFAVAQLFQVDQDPGGDASVNANWRTWLGLLDGAGSRHGSLAAQSPAMLIRNEIARAIQDGTCVGIEFFATPGPSFQALVPFQRLDDPTVAGTYTSIISMQTLTYDKKHPH
jgi:hypothetical protein